MASFVGRERELADAQDALRRTRLLTFTGVGGCGKTQLALHLAGGLLPSATDGVWVIQLAAVSDEALVPRVVAAALGVSGRAEQSIVDTLVAAVAGRNLLLVLDNCEHLITACAHLAEALLRACPDLRILATSREPLRVPGEAVQRVPPLALPSERALTRLELLADVEAIRLFDERARARQPAFRLTGEAAPIVARICQRLDGLPLAIELAAARSGAMSLREIAQDLDESLQLLSRGNRTEPRQETLSATLDWSFALLSDSERRLPSVVGLAGEFGARAAAEVCADSEVDQPTARTLLMLLVDKSLVEVRVHVAEARYRLLEPVRQYAWEHLLAAGKADELKQRHARYYAELAEAAEPELMSANRGGAIDRLAAEEDNLRAALDWARHRPHTADIELGLRLTAALAWFWNFRGKVSEGLDWCDALLARATSEVSPRVRANALHAGGELATLMGQTDLARARLEHSADLYRCIGDTRGRAYVLQALAMCVDPTQALAAATESLRLFQHIADAWGVAHATFSIGMARAASGVFDDSLDEILVPWRALGDQWGTAQALNFLGDVARRQNRDARARRLYEEALALLRELEMPGTVPSILQNLGYVAVRSGDAQAAIRLFRESLVLFRNQGDRRGMADCLEGLAGALTVMKEPEHAARVLGAADALRASTGTAVWRANAADVAATVEKLHEQLAEGQFTAIRAAGRSLTVEDLLAGLESATRAASNQACRDSPLSAREVEVATLVTRGLTNKEIAARLVISERTAATHVARILDKLGLSTRAQIAAWGAQAGLLEQSRGTRGFGAEKGSAILRIAGTPREIS